MSGLGAHFGLYIEVDKRLSQYVADADAVIASQVVEKKEAAAA